MPCRCDDYPSGADRLRAELDRVTRLLCEANKALDALSHVSDPEDRGVELLAWWRDHQKADRDREEREREHAAGIAARDAARTRALEKLTEDERKALGL